jgi:hypothetical protein
MVSTCVRASPISVFKVHSYVQPKLFPYRAYSPLVWVPPHTQHPGSAARASSRFIRSTTNGQVNTLKRFATAVVQTLMDFESLNEITFPFFSACLLEQRSPHTRVAHTRLQSRGWLAALCAPREVGAAAAPAHPVRSLLHSTATFALPVALYSSAGGGVWEPDSFRCRHRTAS